MLAWSDSPCVSAFTRASTNGVTAAPRTPCAPASATACRMASSTRSPAAACSAGIGTPTTAPPGSPSASRALITPATSSALSTRACQQAKAHARRPLSAGL